ncbi:MAG: hypothetical protein JXB13_05240 [Phycisphaerae bacterium]|nr:hypothetical protein [Phycisphaerae bacterium]
MYTEQTAQTGRFAFLFRKLDGRWTVGIGVLVVLLCLLSCFLAVFPWYRDHAALDKRFTHYTAFDQFIGVPCYTTSLLDVSEVGKPGKVTLAEMTAVTPTKVEHDSAKDDWTVYFNDDTRSLVYQARLGPESYFCPVQDFHTAQSLWKGKAVIWEGDPIRDLNKKKVFTLAPQTQVTCLDVRPSSYSFRSGGWPGGVCYVGSFELPSGIVAKTVFWTEDVRLPP